MKRSAFISDLLFTFLAAGLFTLCLFRYLRIPLLPALLLAALCGALAATSVGAFLQSKRKTYFLRKKEQAQKEGLLRHLLFLSDDARTKFFLERLSTPEHPAKRFGALRIYTQDALYALRFSCAPVGEDEVLRFSRVRTNKRKVMLCKTMDENALRLAERLDVCVLNADGVYALCKDSLPDRFLGEDASPRKRRWETWLSRANAKRFLLAAVLTLASALLSPFPYYYVVFGGVLLLLALVIRILGYE